MGILQQGGQSGRSPNALSYKQLGSCAEFIDGNIEFARQKAWDLHKRTDTKSEALVFQHVGISSNLTTGQLKKQLSHLDQIANMKIENYVDSGASLQNELSEIGKNPPSSRPTWPGR